jgi:hypothetical protein
MSPFLKNLAIFKFVFMYTLSPCFKARFCGIIKSILPSSLYRNKSNKPLNCNSLFNLASLSNSIFPCVTWIKACPCFSALSKIPENSKFSCERYHSFSDFTPVSTKQQFLIQNLKILSRMDLTCGPGHAKGFRHKVSKTRKNHKEMHEDGCNILLLTHSFNQTDCSKSFLRVNLSS